MLKNKCIGAMLLAAAAVSSTAMADDRGVNTVVGALAGAAIGGGVGGRNGAIVGGVIGAAVGNSARTRDDYYYNNNRGYAYSSGYSNGYYQQAPAYVESQPVYVESRPVYVESRPVYVEPPRYYYDNRPDVVVVERRGYYEHDRGWHHGWDHDRGWDHGWRR